MWLLSLAGVPMLVLGVDVLRGRRIITFFQTLIWHERTPEVLEARDYIWAMALIVVGLLLALFGVAELINPRPVLAVNEEGLWLRVGHPFSRLKLVPWSDVVDVGADELDDEGDVIPVFLVELADRNQLPEHPWGARWLDQKTLAILSSDWEEGAPQVADRVTHAAMEASRARHPVSS